MRSRRGASDLIDLSVVLCARISSTGRIMEDSDACTMVRAVVFRFV